MKKVKFRRNKRPDEVERALWREVMPGFNYDNPRDDAYDTYHELMRIAKKRAIDFLTKGS